MVRCGLRRNAFTLIELMIVIAIIAILASILIPNFLKAKSQSQYVQCQSNCKIIATTLEVYATDYDSSYPPALSNLSPDYLKVIPTCSSASTDTYSPSYTRVNIPMSYSFYCSGSNHLRVGVGPNYPRYTSSDGLISR